MYFRFFIFIFGSFPAIFSYKKSVYTLSTSLGIENTNLDKNILKEYSQNRTFVNHFIAGYKVLCIIQVIRHYYTRKNSYKAKYDKTFIVLLRFYFFTVRFECFAHIQLVLFCQPQFNKKSSCFDCKSSL